MLVYFDESYDQPDKNYLILGALFNPEPDRLNKRMTEIKTKLKYLNSNGAPKEIKYSITNNRQKFDVAKRCVNEFLTSLSWFRCTVVRMGDGGFDLNRFGRPDETNAIKMARAYKKFAELLLGHNCSTFDNAVLFTDQLTRTKGDLFHELMAAEFSEAGTGYSKGKANPVFRHIQDVDTAEPTYQVGQICDLLMGAVLNTLKPTQNRYKTKFREHVIKQAGLPTLGPEYWGKLAKWEADARHPKLSVWYWRPE